VRRRFELAGASQVIWLFAPSTSYPGFDAYYPGRDVVDWSSTAVLNYGTTARWSKWWSFSELLSPEYGALAALGHPIMLAEVATVHGPGAGAWYEEARASIERFPAVRAVVLFHDPDDRTLGSHSVDFSADRREARESTARFLREFQEPPAAGVVAP
jgi:beta-mannanase